LLGLLAALRFPRTVTTLMCLLLPFCLSCLPACHHQGIDNPDQRIAQDVPLLTSSLADVVAVLMAVPFNILWYSYLTAKARAMMRSQAVADSIYQQQQHHRQPPAQHVVAQAAARSGRCCQHVVLPPSPSAVFRIHRISASTDVSCLASAHWGLASFVLPALLPCYVTGVRQLVASGSCGVVLPDRADAAAAGHAAGVSRGVCPGGR
jgi:hypothetical protein